MMVGEQNYSYIEKIVGYFGPYCGLSGKVKSIHTIKIDSCSSQELQMIETSSREIVPVIFNYTHNKNCFPQFGQEELMVRGDYVPKVGDIYGSTIDKKTHEPVLLKMVGGHTPYVPTCKGSIIQDNYILVIILLYILLSGIILGNYFYKKYKHRK